MAGTKATTLTLRIDPAIKEGLRAVAAQEHRSLANMIEVMILDYCGRNGVTIAEQCHPVNTKQAAKTNQEKSPRAKKNA